jgi:hypothetical protein
VGRCLEPSARREPRRHAGVSTKGSSTNLHLPFPVLGNAPWLLCDKPSTKLQNPVVSKIYHTVVVNRRLISSRTPAQWIFSSAPLHLAMSRPSGCSSGREADAAHDLGAPVVCGLRSCRPARSGQKRQCNTPWPL